MNVSLIIKTTIKNKKMVNVRFRLIDGRRNDLFVKSEFSVDIRFWDVDNECYRNVKACPYSLQDRKDVKDKIAMRKIMIEDIYLGVKDKGSLTSKIFNEHVQNHLKYGEDTAVNMDLMINQMNYYLQEKKFSPPKVKSFNTLIKSVVRFQNYCSFVQNHEVKIMMSDVNAQFLRDYRNFMHNEINYIKKYPTLYADDPISKRLKVRSKNYVEELLIRLRSFWNWCVNDEKVSHNPFRNFDIEPPVYGDPIVMTENEIGILEMATIKDPKLDKARDYMVFCSNVGCRPSEAVRLMKSNLINNQEDGHTTKNVVYFQHKGARRRITKIDNPLNQAALNVVNKYQISAGKRLLPKLNLQEYNKDLKNLFKTLGLNRNIAVFDRRTGEESVESLDKMVSAHMGRRNFISAVANLGVDKAVYTQMSGHQINTPHLARYILATNKSKKDIVDRIHQRDSASDYFQQNIG